jgi:hypothetical protein
MVVHSKELHRGWSDPRRRILILFSILFVAGSLACRAAPILTGFAPSSGPPGTSVTIAGSGLSGTAQVQFGTALAIFSVVSDSQLIVTVPLEATSGPITVQGNSGIGVSASSFFVSPRITSFSPASGPPGASVQINGNNFEGTLAVQFNGTNSTFFATSPTQIQTVVPAGATSGPIRVVTGVDSAVSDRVFFVTANEPFITEFSPTNGAPGTVVTLTGGNFTGATAVEFNGTNAAAFSVTASTQLRVTVPSGASSGPISVTTALGTGQSAAPFAVTTAPVITDFEPIGGAAGTAVVINGMNFAGTTAVQFNGTNASGFSVTAPTQINALVPPGATPGPITITSSLGSGTSTGTFFAGNAPLIADFSPTNGFPGSIVTVNGLNFSSVTQVSIGGAPASFQATAATQINALVPATATNGPIVVSNASGTNSSVDRFYIRTGKPIVVSLDPTTGLPGTTVTIEGLDLTGASVVTFNGTNALFSAVSDTQISAVVPDNATTGPISVVTAAGTGASLTDFVVAPRIASFTPTNGAAGTSVTIQGTNFTQVSAVRFGQVAGAVTTTSANQLTVVVPDSAVTDSINVTTPAGIVATPDPFIVLPTVQSFSPPSGTAGALVTINGTGFAGVSGVSFGGINTPSFSVVSATQILALLPDRGRSGPITVTTSSGSASSATSFFVGAAADLTVSQSGSATSVLQEQVLVYTILWTNLGPATATSVLVADQLPPSVLVMSAKTSVGLVMATNGLVQASIASASEGAGGQLTISLLVLATGTLTNAVSISANEPDFDATNNTSTLVTTVLTNPAVLQLSRVSPTQLSISWPVSATNLVLQWATILSPPNWQTVNKLPIVSDGTKSLLISPSSQRSFYRLASP